MDVTSNPTTHGHENVSSVEETTHRSVTTGQQTASVFPEFTDSSFEIDNSISEVVEKIIQRTSDVGVEDSIQISGTDSESTNQLQGQTVDKMNEEIKTATSVSDFLSIENIPSPLVSEKNSRPDRSELSFIIETFQAMNINSTFTDTMTNVGDLTFDAANISHNISTENKESVTFCEEALCGLGLGNQNFEFDKTVEMVSVENLSSEPPNQKSQMSDVEFMEEIIDKLMSKYSDISDGDDLSSTVILETPTENIFVKLNETYETKTNNTIEEPTGNVFEVINETFPGSPNVNTTEILVDQMNVPSNALDGINFTQSSENTETVSEVKSIHNPFVGEDAENVDPNSGPIDAYKSPKRKFKSRKSLLEINDNFTNINIVQQTLEDTKLSPDSKAEKINTLFEVIYKDTEEISVHEKFNFSDADVEITPEITNATEVSEVLEHNTTEIIQTIAMIHQNPAEDVAPTIADVSEIIEDNVAEILVIEDTKVSEPFTSVDVMTCGISETVMSAAQEPESTIHSLQVFNTSENTFSGVQNITAVFENPTEDVTLTMTEIDNVSEIPVVEQKLENADFSEAYTNCEIASSNLKEISEELQKITDLGHKSAETLVCEMISEDIETAMSVVAQELENTIVSSQAFSTSENTSSSVQNITAVFENPTEDVTLTITEIDSVSEIPVVEQKLENADFSEAYANSEIASSNLMEISEELQKITDLGHKSAETLVCEMISEDIETAMSVVAQELENTIVSSQAFNTSENTSSSVQNITAVFENPTEDITLGMTEICNVSEIPVVEQKLENDDFSQAHTNSDICFSNVMEISEELQKITEQCHHSTETVVCEITVDSEISANNETSMSGMEISENITAVREDFVSEMTEVAPKSAEVNATEILVVEQKLDHIAEAHRTSEITSQDITEMVQIIQNITADEDVALKTTESIASADEDNNALESAASSKLPKISEISSGVADTTTIIDNVIEEGDNLTENVLSKETATIPEITNRTPETSVTASEPEKVKHELEVSNRVVEGVQTETSDTQTQEELNVVPEIADVPQIPVVQPLPETTYDDKLSEMSVAEENVGKTDYTKTTSDVAMENFETVAYSATSEISINKTETSEAVIQNENQISSTSELAVDHENVKIEASIDGNESFESALDESECHLNEEIESVNRDSSLKSCLENETSFEASGLGYNQLMLASPSVLETKMPQFQQFSQLKLQMNSLQQQISQLKLDNLKKERAILKLEEQNQKITALYEGQQVSDNENKPMALELANADKKIVSLIMDNKKTEEKYEVELGKLRKLVKKQAEEISLLGERLKTAEQENKTLKTVEEEMKKLKTVDDENRKLKMLLKQGEEIFLGFRQKLKQESAVNADLMLTINALKEKNEKCVVVIKGMENNEKIYKEYISQLQKNTKAKP